MARLTTEVLKEQTNEDNLESQILGGKEFEEPVEEIEQEQDSPEYDDVPEEPEWFAQAHDEAWNDPEYINALFRHINDELDPKNELDAQYTKNVAEISIAGKQGAKEKDIRELADVNDSMYETGKAYEEIEKTAKTQREKEEAAKDKREILDGMQRFGAKIHIASLSVKTKGLTVYSKIAKPFEKQHEKQLKKGLKRTIKKRTSLELKLQRERKKIDRKARVSMQKDVRKLTRKGKSVSGLTIDLYKKETSKASSLESRVARHKTKEAVLHDKLETSKHRRVARVEQAIHNQEIIKQTKENIQYSKATARERRAQERTEKREEKAAWKEELAQDRENYKREMKELKERLNQKEPVQKDEDEKQEKQEKKNMTKEEKREVKAAGVLAARLALIEQDKKELAASGIIKGLERDLKVGQVVDIETKTDKMKAMKDLTGSVVVAKWDTEKKAFYNLSKLETISAFAKDHVTVQKTINEQVKTTVVADKNEKALDDVPVR